VSNKVGRLRRSVRRALRLAVVAVVASAFGACSSSAGRAGNATSTSAAATGETSATTTTPTTRGTTRSGARWTTYYGNGARTGLASDGPSRPASVRRLWEAPALDGDVYAQPLLTGSKVIVATENDTVYALGPADGAILWKRHLGEPVDAASMPCGNVYPVVGITGTPVVDVDAGRIYVVGLVQPAHHVLFALALATGRVLSTVRVDAAGADAAVHNQRGALTLSHGTVFVPYGGRYGDCGDYHGRVVAVAISGRASGQVRSYTLPTQREGGFWAPPGPVVDAGGDLLLASGNSSSSDRYDYGNSVVRLTPALKLADSWAPTNWVTLNSGDVDVGSSSPVLLGNRVFQIGKAGVGYLLDGDHLGGIGGELHSDDVCGGGGVFGGIAHDGNTMFVPCRDGVVQVTVTGDTFATGWKSQVSTPGPTMVANGAVWTVATEDGDLLALDESTGRPMASEHLGTVPSQFTSPAAGGGRVVVAAGAVVAAFGT
jgi:outer membrane protein assembly factor BamB